nr:hypothetical protein [uncultured Psychroserpens sp.]
MKKRIIKYVLILISLFAVYYIYDFVTKISNKNEGLFGHSKSRENAINNGFTVVDFKPSKDTLTLINGRKIVIKKVWSEVSWTYHNGKPQIADEYGHTLCLEFSGKQDDFVFTFSLLDKKNQQFTNGIGDSICHLKPKKLYDFIDTVLREKNPKKNVGWKNGLVTDTIRMTKTEIKNVP